jgi:tetratricopeptide (TPR) repeat protein
MADMDRNKRTRLLALIVIMLLGSGIAAAWQQRQRIVWSLADASPAALALGPVSAQIPAGLPAGIRFSLAGDVILSAGEGSFDAMAVEITVMPTEERLEGEAATETLQRLRLSLLTDEPGASAEIAPHRALPALAVRGRQGGRSLVVLAGQSLVRLEVLIAPRAPSKWRAAAHSLPGSLRIEETLVADGVWRAFRPLALEACQRRDLAACAFAARASLEAGEANEAAALAAEVLAEQPPVEDDAEGRAAILALVRLRGEAEIVAGRPAKALEAWGTAWSRDESGALAARLLEVAAGLIGAEVAEAEAWVDRANEAASRFEDRPAVALAAARVASAAGRYDDAKALARRVYDEAKGDTTLLRRAVSVRVAPITPPPPLACPRGTTRRIVDHGSTREEACMEASGARRGPVRRFYANTGALISETTWDNGSEGAPDRRFWENGVMQRRSLMDARGQVTVESFDPFGRPVVEDDAPAEGP